MIITKFTRILLIVVAMAPGICMAADSEPPTSVRETTSPEEISPEKVDAGINAIRSYNIDKAIDLDKKIFIKKKRLELKKLEQELRDIGGGSVGGDISDSDNTIKVANILIRGDNERSAEIIYGGYNLIAHEGLKIGPMTVGRITPNYVVFDYQGGDSRTVGVEGDLEEVIQRTPSTNSVPVEKNVDQDQAAADSKESKK